MFRSKNLFQDVPCPSTYSDPPKPCNLLRCFFSHDVSAPRNGDSAVEPPTKRRRIDETNGNGRDSARNGFNSTTAGQSSDITSTVSRATEKPTTPNPLKRPPPTTSPKPAPRALKQTATSTPASKPSAMKNSIAAPRSQLGQVVAPKPVAPRPVRPVTTRAPPKAQTLLPRLVANAPEQFETRVKLLKLLNCEYARLLELPTDDPALIEYTLTEEETLAKEKGKAYAMVTKLKVTSLRKLKPENFKAEREEFQRNRERRLTGRAISPPPEKKPKVTDPAEFRVDTGLTKEEELEALKDIVHSEKELQEYGYVMKVPEEKDVEEMRKAVALLDGFEACDRCGTRFQVFPGRNEAGQLTSGGKCTYHWGKPIMQQVGQAGLATSRVRKYVCCGEEQGASGCQESPNHVFGARSAVRLSILMPYVSTNVSSSGPTKAYSLDCEMGYTTLGFEPIRVTLLNYPEHTRAVDALIRPFGEILDLNTRFSGVTKEQFLNAVPFTSDTPTDALSHTPSFNASMPIFPSPTHARTLLLNHFITSNTILLGHALENDLNTLRIIHPLVIDTAILFPHSRGLPMRNKLRFIVQRTLGLTIQSDEKTEGEEIKGHDSALDARCAAECVRFRIKQGKGWKTVQRKEKRKESGVIDGVGATMDRLREDAANNKEAVASS